MFIGAARVEKEPKKKERKENNNCNTFEFYRNGPRRCDRDEV